MCPKCVCVCSYLSCSSHITVSHISTFFSPSSLFYPPSPPVTITATLILLPVLMCRAQHCLSGQISPFIITIVIPSTVHTPSLASLSGLLPWPQWALLSGNQAGRAHFSAHIILHIITNEYELPSVGHPRTELGREGGEWGRGRRGVPVLCWHINKLMHYSFSRMALTHTHTHISSSNKVSSGTGSPAGM